MAYLILMSALFINGFLYMMMFKKGEIELFINRNWSPAADVFYPYYTHVGDGLTFTAVIVILLFVKYYYALSAALVFGVSSLMAQFLKRVVFFDEARPKIFFTEGHWRSDFHVVPGVDIHHHLSFPSGHTTTAFALATFIVLYLLGSPKYYFLQLVCFVMALFVGVSRIYLIQHFFIDTYFGAMLGSIFAGFVYMIAHSNTQLRDNKFLQGSLLRKSG
ncbi:MAG: phosphatase PAP2 family protein [Cytophagales bacterium]|nr:phosphatase PAP2 family protein [Cytophagales bacterium]